MSEHKDSFYVEENGDTFDCLPDITQYSQSERDELLQRLLKFKEEENTNHNQSHDNFDNDNNDDDYHLSYYESKYIIKWYITSLFGAFLFSSYNYICMTYQRKDYCKDPKLDDLTSWIIFIITLLITIWYLGKLSHTTVTSYQLAKGVINETDNKFIKGDNSDDFEIYLKYKKIGKWMLGFHLLSLMMLFILYYFVIVFASYREMNRFIFKNPESVIFGTKYSFGIFIFILIYFPILSSILCLLLYQRFCDSLYDISVTYSLKNNYNIHEYNHKLLKFRNTLCNLKLFVLYIPLFGPYIIVILWNWQFWLLMNLTFGQWNNGIYIWSIFSGIVSSCCLVLYSLSRKKLSNYFGDIFALCISRKILPINQPILSNEINIHNDLNINMQLQTATTRNEKVTKWKLFRVNTWPKIRKWCINLHSVLTIIVCIGLINYVSQPAEYDTNYAFRWMLTSVISWTILISTGYLVTQLCSKDIHHRITVLYKSWLLIIKIFFIRRCKFIVENDNATNDHIFMCFQYLFTVFSVFGIVIFLMITTKFELIYFNNSNDIKVILGKLFPGYIEFEINFCNLYVNHILFYKWQILRLSFCGSILMIFGSVIWCISFANSGKHENILSFELCYIFIWIVPQLCLHNEIVQYIQLHLKWTNLINIQSKQNEIVKKKSVLNNQFTISLSTLQLIQPIVIFACILSFIYLVIFGYHRLGHVPVVFCGIQLFINTPLSIASIWK